MKNPPRVLTHSFVKATVSSFAEPIENTIQTKAKHQVKYKSRPGSKSTCVE